MSKSALLTLGFLEFHPGDAADALEALDTEDAAAFLDDVPARICAPVLSAALPWAAAAWIEQLSPGHAAAVLSSMDFADAVTALRLVPDAHTQVLLGEVSSTLARSLKRSLTYPSITVGAWMDQSIPTFSEDTTVAEGLKYLKSRRRRPIPHLTVVGAAKRFAGIVSTSELLRSASSIPLSQIMDASVTPLSSRSLLATVLENPSWDSYASVPVVGRKDNVLGSLTRSNLKKGLRNTDIARNSDYAQSIPAQLLTGYLAVVSGLLQMLLDDSANKQPTTK